MAGSLMVEASATTACVLCGFEYPDDNVGFAHFNLCHVTDFMRHLRERRLQDLFPRADPLFFEILYNGDDSWYRQPPDHGHNSDNASMENGIAADQVGISKAEDMRSATSTPCTSEIPVSTPTKIPLSSPTKELADPRILAKPATNQMSLATNQMPSKTDQDQATGDNRSREKFRRTSRAGRSEQEYEERSSSMTEGGYGIIDHDQSDRQDDQVFLSEEGERPTTGTGSSWDASAYSETRTASRSRSRSPWRRSPSPSRLARRRSSYRNDTLLRAPLMPFIYRNVKFIDQRREYKQIPVNCVVCKKQFENFLEATQHDLQTHGNLRRLRCGFGRCSYEAPSTTELHSHVVDCHSVPNPRFFCRFCKFKFNIAQKYVDHAWDEYCKLRRIQYQQIALQSLTVECEKCNKRMMVREWFSHCRRECGMKEMDEDTRTWIEETATFCCHQRSPCKFFPICDPSRCAFSHPICAHYPDCFNYKNGICPLDHSVKDRQRKCSLCQKRNKFNNARKYDETERHEWDEYTKEMRRNGQDSKEDQD